MGIGRQNLDSWVQRMAEFYDFLKSLRNLFSIVVFAGLLILSPKTVPNLLVNRPNSLIQEQLGAYN